MRRQGDQCLGAHGCNHFWAPPPSTTSYLCCGQRWQRNTTVRESWGGRPSFRQGRAKTQPIWGALLQLGRGGCGKGERGRIGVKLVGSVTRRGGHISQGGRWGGWGVAGGAASGGGVRRGWLRVVGEGALIRLHLSSHNLR
jgi:hypothetical protein